MEVIIPTRLIPSEEAQERLVTLAQIEAALKPGFDPRWQRIWEEFKSKVQDGDELWEFCSDRESWEALAGHAGYRIIRGDKTVGQILTRLN